MRSTAERLLRGDQAPSRPAADERQQRLRWLMVVRLLVATTLLASTVAAHLQARSAEEVAAVVPLYVIVAISFVGNLLYALLVRLRIAPAIQVWSQLVGDLIIAALIVYLTGGVLSAFSFLFILAAINGGALLERHGAIVLASLISIAYGVQLTLQLYGVLPAPGVDAADLPAASAYFTTLGAHLLGIVVAAFLTNVLAEQARRAGGDLSRLQNIHQQVLWSLPVGVVMSSAGRVLMANPLARAMLRLPAQVTPEVHEPALLAGGGPMTAVQTLDVPGQGARDVRLQTAPLVDADGRAIGQITTLSDVTEVRAMERRLAQSQRLASLGELAAGIAHEIRNPLASLRGATELLASRRAHDAAEQRLMEIVLREIDRLDRLIADFLAYARPSPPRPEEVDVAELIAQTISLAAGAAPDQAPINYQPPGGALRARLDPAQLRQVLWNLLRNALDACAGTPGAAVSISAEADGHQLVLRVCDSGVGMDPAHQERLFTPFFTTKEGGSGLGLALVHRIVEAHHGRIDLQSQPGRGTECTVSLPLAGPAPDAHEGDARGATPWR